MGFSRQEYWSGWPFPSLGDLPNPDIELGPPVLQADALPSEPPEKPITFLSPYSISEWLRGTKSAANAGAAGDRVLFLSREDPQGENSNPLQYSCLENPLDRGAWQATVHGVTKSQTRLSD